MTLFQDASAAQRDASAAVDRATAAVADEAMATAAVTVVVGVGLIRHICIVVKQVGEGFIISFIE